MAEESDKIAQRILHRLDDEILPDVKRNGEIVKAFADRLQTFFENHVLLRKAQVMHGGSAYESLEVNKNTDFDITVVLGEPYVASNFMIFRDESGFFLMRPLGLNIPLTDSAGFLDARALRDQLFENLVSCVDGVRSSGFRVTCKPLLSSLMLEIFAGSGIISVDLVPMMTCRTWGPCQDLVALEDLPYNLSQHVKILEENCSPVLFFSPAAPGRHPNIHRLCTIAFNVLEKRFLRFNPEVRKMIRLLKLVSETQNWKKFGLKSFHMKRMAIKYFGELEDKSLWNGYRTLLLKMCVEIHKNNFDGFFIKNQKTYMYKEETAAQLRSELIEAYGWSAAAVEVITADHFEK